MPDDKELFEMVLDEAKREVSEALRDVENARAKLNKDLQQLQNSTNREWEDLKDKVEDDVDALEDAVERATDRADETEPEIKGEQPPAGRSPMNKPE